MALQKEIELDNGVIINYHRITSLNNITNVNTLLEVSSYINENQRNKEKRYQEVQKKHADGEDLTEEEMQLLEKGIDVFIESDFITIPYDEAMTIESAYDYLKTTDKYSGSIDV